MLGDLSLIRYNFDKAAQTYQDHAHIQKSTARYLQSIIKKVHGDGVMLDLGSGPGTLSPEELCKNLVINYDLSLAMLKSGISRQAVNGDAALLPFANQSFTTILSNLMLQWPSNKNAVFAEISRVLRPGGYCLFTTLVKGSLEELELAWQAVDDARHILEFLPPKDYFGLCQAHGLSLVNQTQWRETLHFNYLHDLFRHFRLTGTNLPKSTASTGLGGKKKLMALELAYEKYKTTQGLPLTYYYLMTVTRKD